MKSSPLTIVSSHVEFLKSNTKDRNQSRTLIPITYNEVSFYHVAILLSRATWDKENGLWEEVGLKEIDSDSVLASDTVCNLSEAQLDLCIPELK